MFIQRMRTDGLEDEGRAEPTAARWSARRSSGPYENLRPRPVRSVENGSTANPVGEFLRGTSSFHGGRGVWSGQGPCGPKRTGSDRVMSCHVMSCPHLSRIPIGNREQDKGRTPKDAALLCVVGLFSRSEDRPMEPVQPLSDQKMIGSKVPAKSTEARSAKAPRIAQTPPAMTAPFPWVKERTIGTTSP